MPDENRQPILRSEFANDPEIGELVDQFVAEMPARVAALREAFLGGDAARLRTMAHQLKGAAGGYGFPTIGEVARRVEQCLKSERSPEITLQEVRASLDELVAMCRRVAPMEQ